MSSASQRVALRLERRSALPARARACRDPCSSSSVVGDLRGDVLVVARARRRAAASRDSAFEWRAELRRCRPGRRDRPSRPSAASYFVSDRPQACRNISLQSTASRARHPVTRRTPAAGTRPRRRRFSGVVSRAYSSFTAHETAAAVVRRAPGTRATSASHAVRALAPSGTRAAAPLAPAISRSRAKSRIVTSMPAPARPAAPPRPSGSAVAPSIQTSPPSKCSCFQIGAICLTRSIA